MCPSQCMVSVMSEMGKMAKTVRSHTESLTVYGGLLLVALVAVSAISVDTRDQLSYAQSSTDTIKGIPHWLSHLIVYLDGGTISDHQFWDSVEQLIITRLAGDYVSGSALDLVERAELTNEAYDRFENKIEIEINRIDLAGLQTGKELNGIKKGKADVVLEYDIINISSGSVTFSNMQYNLFGNGVLVYSGTVLESRTIGAYDRLVVRDSIIITRDSENPAAMTKWFNGIDVFIFDGTLQVAGSSDTYAGNKFRSSVWT